MPHINSMDECHGWSYRAVLQVEVSISISEKHTGSNKKENFLQPYFYFYDVVYSKFFQLDNFLFAVFSSPTHICTWLRHYLSGNFMR